MHNNYDLEKFLSIIQQEFTESDYLVSNHAPYITFFGSARLKSDDYYYKKCYELAHLLAKDGHNIITGGGPGIMEAANKGAFEGGSTSVGLNIQIPEEQHANLYQHYGYTFHHFFTRKVMLAKYSHLFIIFPGGFGTLDEITEIMTLMQNQKAPPAPIVYFGSEFWNDYFDFLNNKLLKRDLIVQSDLDEIIITDDIQTIISLAKETKQKSYV